MRMTSPPAALWLIGLCLLLVFEAGCTTAGRVRRSTADFPSNAGFVSKTITLDERDYRYAVFVPREYDAAEPLPAILFLHGLFEAGRNGERQLTAGLAPIIADNPDAWPFIVIFPQSSGTWIGESRDRLAMACLDQAMAEYAIDPERVILSGMSFGGRGVWSIGARHRERFAALVPFSAVSGDFDPLKFLTIPIWAFHNSGDPLASARASREFCRRVADAGGKVTYTQFPALAHDSCVRACAETDLIEWMLQQRR